MCHYNLKNDKLYYEFGRIISGSKDLRNLSFSGKISESINYGKGGNIIKVKYSRLNSLYSSTSLAKDAFKLDSANSILWIYANETEFKEELNCSESCDILSEIGEKRFHCQKE